MIDWSMLAVFIAVLVGILFNNQRVGSLQREIDMLRTSLLAEMAAMKREILAEIKVLHAEIKALDTRVAALEREMHGTR